MSQVREKEIEKRGRRIREKRGRWIERKMGKREEKGKSNWKYLLPLIYKLREGGIVYVFLSL